MKRGFAHTIFPALLALALGSLLAAASPRAAVGQTKTQPSLPLVHRAGTWGLLLRDVALRPGVTADMFVHIYGLLSFRDCQFAVHGGVYAAASWKPYARELGWYRCVLAVDLPGRGGSSFPRGALFGELTLDDYVTGLVGVLDRLEALCIEPRTIVGHSMGGTLVQMLQQRLVDQGTSLRQRFDIREAILVAPDLPAEVPWALGDSGELSELIEAFAVDEPGLGTLFEIPAELWPSFFFTNLSGVVVANAPTPEEIEEEGYHALGEPLVAIHQLNGTGGFSSRPSIDAGIFDDDLRTWLLLVTYEQDAFVRPNETEALYRHLTGDPGLRCFVLVEGEDTVHALQLNNPELLADTITAVSPCVYPD